MYGSKSTLPIIHFKSSKSQRPFTFRLYEGAGLGQGKTGGKLKVISFSPASYVSCEESTIYHIHLLQTQRLPGSLPGSKNSQGLIFVFLCSKTDPGLTDSTMKLMVVNVNMHSVPSTQPKIADGQSEVTPTTQICLYLFFEQYTDSSYITKWIGEFVNVHHFVLGNLYENLKKLSDEGYGISSQLLHFAIGFEM